MDIILGPKVPIATTKFECINCHYTTSRESQYIRHVATAKHQRVHKGYTNDINLVQKVPDTTQTICHCGKEYKHYSGLWRHKKKCSQPLPADTDLSNSFLPTPAMPLDMNIMLELLKQNQEFKELIVEQNKYMIELAGKVGNTTNNNNNTNIKNQHNNNFNLQVFLNETCKDAICINDFIKDLPVSFQQLENIGQNGYVVGMTNVILTQLKTMDVSKRPLHCTDAKRDTMYIKQPNEWIKDDIDHTMMTQIFRRIANHNLRTISEWSQMHPSSQESGTNENEFCTNVMLNSLGALGDTQCKMDNAVLKSIAKSVLVERMER
jgi:hypothetical protein